jgi:threonine aldolase
MKIIDLRSDTITRPNPRMRQAMADAEVGDDFYRDDPTVAAFEERAAALLGQEAAMLVLSGTMGNIVSLLSSTRRGDSILVADNSHIYLNEAGNLAAVAGLLPSLVSHPQGLHCGEQISAALRPDSVLYAPLSLVCIENTLNAGGGHALGAAATDAIVEIAHAHGLKVHLDGARIFNAAAALGLPATALSRNVDSITFCLSKGLGCPLGSVVAGSKDFVAAARRWRQVIGGGMRQAGVIAAAGQVALDYMVDRLAEDHINARRLAELLAEGGLDPALDVQTNMVFVDIPPAACPQALVGEMRKRGVIVNAAKGRRLRFVTHADVSAADIEEAGRRVAAALEAATRALQPDEVN